MEGRIKETLKEVEEKRSSKRSGRKGWWNEECWSRKK